MVGLAPDAQLSVTPTLFVGYDTYLAAVAARNPGGGDPLPNALAVVPAEGTTPAEVVTAINAGSDDLDALTREQAADRSPASPRCASRSRSSSCSTAWWCRW